MSFITGAILCASLAASAGAADETTATAAAGARGSESQAAATSEAAPADAQGPMASDAGAQQAAIQQRAMQEKMVETDGRLAATEEQLSEMKGDVSSLKKLKLSGYIQGRYTSDETSKEGLDADGKTVLVKNGFSIRRGRLKATYTGSWSAYVLQIDATPKGIALKDAEVRLIEPWTGYRLEAVLGQQKWPFGYEVLQSSGDREFPERTRVVRAFAPGERDRGLKLVGNVKFLKVQLGLFDGTGTENKAFPGIDNDHYEDAIGRLGVDFGTFVAGVSGWYGQTRRPADYANGVNPEKFPRTRYGADAQIYLDLLPIGGTALKGELIYGKTWSKSGVEQYGVKAMGGYAQLIQNLALGTAVALRYDYFDQDVDKANKVDDADPTKLASSNAIHTLGAALIYNFDESWKGTMSYEVPLTAVAADAKDPEDNLFTVQMQAKF